MKFLERRENLTNLFHVLMIAGNIITINFAVTMIELAVIVIDIVGAHEAKSNPGDEFRT